VTREELKKKQKWGITQYEIYPKKFKKTHKKTPPVLEWSGKFRKCGKIPSVEKEIGKNGLRERGGNKNKPSNGKEGF